jgi:uncharacterized protein
MIKPNIKKKLNLLAKKYDLKFLVLFGSRANGTYNNLSDWDFAFFPQKNFSIEDEMDLFDSILFILKNEKVDIINLKNQQDYLLRKNIAQNSILIYEEEKGIYDDFQVNSIFNYIDYLPIYKVEEDIVNKKLKNL